MKAHYLRTEGGEELVVLSRRDYERLLAHVEADEAELRSLELEAAAIESRAASGEETIVTGFPADMPHLGAPILRSRRERSGRAAAEVAAAAGLSLDIYEAIEGGRHFPETAVWRRLAEVLDIDPSWLPGAHPEARRTWSDL
jgi:hypothetical protein